MKSFLTPVLLSLLVLSITLKELSGEELKCYAMGFGKTVADQEIRTCNGDDLACVTAVDINTGEPKLKGCSSKKNLESQCNSKIISDMKAECKDPCSTELCNDEK